MREERKERREERAREEVHVQREEKRKSYLCEALTSPTLPRYYHLPPFHPLLPPTPLLYHSHTHHLPFNVSHACMTQELWVGLGPLGLGPAAAAAALARAAAHAHH